MRTRQFVKMLVVLAAIAGWTQRASADRLRDLVREGNSLFTEEKYDEALEKYRSAQVESPESPELYFNIANALQRQGKYPEAIEEYGKAHSRQRPELGMMAAYNIGVIQYRQAEEKVGTQEYKEAMTLLEACMESNRDAMRLDPTDADPKFNYEQAKRKWKEVLDALKKQQEEQQKQQDQQNQNQDSHKDEQQKDEQQKDEQQKDEQDQNNQQQEGANEDQASSGTSQPQPQPQAIGEMTPEEVERILNSLPEQNAEEMRRFQMLGAPRGRGLRKDW